MTHWTENLEEGRRIFRFERAALDNLNERKEGLLMLIRSIELESRVLEERILEMAQKIYTEQEIYNAKNPLQP